MLHLLTGTYYDGTGSSYAVMNLTSFRLWSCSQCFRVPEWENHVGKKADTKTTSTLQGIWIVLLLDSIINNHDHPASVSVHPLNTNQPSVLEGVMFRVIEQA